MGSPYFTSDTYLDSHCFITVRMNPSSLHSSDYFFLFLNIFHPLISLRLCFPGSDSTVTSQWGWAKVTSQSTDNSTVIACCPPGEARERQRSDKRHRERNVRKKWAQKNGGPKRASSRNRTMESGEQTEGRQTSRVGENLCQRVSRSWVCCEGRLLRPPWVTEVVLWQGCTR